jgi:hypothetical protein
MVPLVLRLSKPNDMTIHWKAFMEHFMMVLLFFYYHIFWEYSHFLFSTKYPGVLQLNFTLASLGHRLKWYTVHNVLKPVQHVDTPLSLVLSFLSCLIL